MILAGLTLALGALLQPASPRPRLARVEPAAPVFDRLQSGLLSILVGAALTATQLPVLADDAPLAVTPEKAALEQALQRAKAENDYLKSVTLKQEQESMQLQSKAASLSGEEQARVGELTRVRNEAADKAVLAIKQAEQLKQLMQAEAKLVFENQASSEALARVQADTPPPDNSWLLPLGLGGAVVVQAVAIFKVLQEKQALEEQLSGRR